MGAMHRLAVRLDDIRTFYQLPRVQIDLMHGASVARDPLYADMVHRFWTTTRQRHPRFPLLRQETHGVALSTLPSSFDEYFSSIEGSARRNWKKANRNGCRFGPLRYAEHLDEARAIVESTNTRQGRLPPGFMEDLHEHANPPNRTSTHAYRHFGVFEEGRLVAFADIFVAGEVAMLTTILGHHAHQKNGVVPFLIISSAGAVLKEHPAVRYYSYGMFFGASPGLRRFKRRFGFTPHRVDWHLG